MKKTLQPVTASLRVSMTMACLLMAALVTGRPLDARFGRRDRGALSLEQAIITAVLSGAAIVLGGVILAAILGHQNNIR